ncbi:MAG: NADH-quinone oxidoreductase subunit [Acidobacteriota bacterium]|nr:NADH-quinone oxidoreductase subunit [Acidobacteriota bacterium]
MNPFGIFAPPNFLDDLLLRFFSAETANYVVWPFIQIGAVVTLVAGWALYASYLERKISAFMQARLGPMRVGKWGLLQPIADALKLLTKEDLVPEKADPYIFRYAPYIAVAATFITFSVIPFAPNWGVITDVNIGLLLILSISSVGVLALILAGWSSNSKYALLGGLRSSAQMVSYEVSMGLSLIGALMFARTLSLSGIVGAQAADGPLPYLFYQPLAFVVFLISGIAENNRAPFDLPEAESELVAGFHTEYSGMRWSLFFMAEYAAMVVVAAVATTVFLGGWYFPGVLRVAGGYNSLYVVLSLVVFMVKMALLLYVYFWLRWTFPRYRYDQLMDLGWKWMIPASIMNIVWTGLTVFSVQGLDGWRGMRTLEPLRGGVNTLSLGLNLTGEGKVIAIVFGWVGLLLGALMLGYLNRHSRDFNLRKQRREIRLVDVPKGAPAVATTAAVSEG